jgi:hypothetical protein
VEWTLFERAIKTYPVHESRRFRARIASSALDNDSPGARVVKKVGLAWAAETRRFALEECLFMKGRKVAE